jgi:hypothetical protein
MHHRQAGWRTAPSDPMTLLGILLERSEWLCHRVEKIDTRLEAGDTRMDEMTEATRNVERTLEAIKAARERPEKAMPGWERVAKVIAPYLIVPLAAWASGSWQVALDLARVLAGK